MLTSIAIYNIIDKYGCDRENILFILREIQDKDKEHQLKEAYIKFISDKVNIKVEELYELITFYSMLNDKPQGKFIIEVCNSGPCYVSKVKPIVEHLEAILGIRFGGTTSDGMFTLKSTSCIGACDISPVMKIGEILYGNLTKEKVDDILSLIRREESDVIA